MDCNLNKMCDWERKKAIFILGLAENNLDMDCSGYGELAVNPNSGYTYLWLEDYPFTLYMPIDCALVKTDVVALWTNPEDGEEIEYELKNETTLDDLINWCETLDKKYRKD